MNVFSPGADTLTTTTDDIIGVSQSLITSESNIGTMPAGGRVTTFAFGGGSDTFENAGALVIGLGGFTSGASLPLAASLELVGLETFDNAGVIALGAVTSGGTTVYGDSIPDDVLRMTSGVFNGLDGSRVIMDVDMLSTQTNCTDRSNRAIQFGSSFQQVLPLLAAADCLDLRGASTAGRTELVIGDLVPAVRGHCNPVGILLVDVAGAGTSAAEHFAIAPDSDNYDPMFGGVINKGDFMYVLSYDAEAQQHKILGLPTGDALQFAPLALAAQSIWRVSSDAVTSRQNDLRLHPDDEGMGGSIWMRATGDYATRDVPQSVEALGITYAFDNSYEQDTIAVTAGGDIRLGANAFVGASLGYARSNLEFDETVNRVEFRGFTGGVYGGLSAGGFFLDASVHGSGLTMDESIPALNLQPLGTRVTTEFKSVGARAETGWRWALTDAAYVEPLAAVSYVRTAVEDLELGTSGDPLFPGNTYEFENIESLRTGLGARAGLLGNTGAMRMQATLTGRVWNESEGESRVSVLTTGPGLDVIDAFTGTFSDLSAALAMSDDTGMFNGFVQAGGKFGDDYQATNLSAGVRYRW